MLYLRGEAGGVMGLHSSCAPKELNKELNLGNTPTRRQDMAKQQHGNREAKKPKKEKPKAAVAVSPFANPEKGGVPLKVPQGKR